MVRSKVLSELKKNLMSIIDNLVGIDHHIENMMGLLNVESKNALIVGILGMGGIGKTTIAKVIFNQLSELFDYCCFIEDVREMSQQHNGLVSLQNQLISMILKRKCYNIVNVDEGIKTIKDVVRKKKVLIVLDDVSEKSHIDKLAGNPDWFGLGSRIIVTTRNKEVLDGLNVDRIYEPPLMKHDHSLQLFSKHAFRRDCPPEDYEILSREVVSTAAGLPLALEIIGSLLLGKGKVVWKDILTKLKEIPDDKVQEKLIISYKALDTEHQQIFIDIACLFTGEDKRYPFYMWDDCQFYPNYGIDVLVLRSLVKVGDDNKLWMHDQLRGLGRQIVRGENSDPGERSRLWFHEDALDVLERQMGTKKVEALSLKVESRSLCLKNEEFRLLPNLRFLRVPNADLSGDFKHLFSKLRWLDWSGCPGNCTPTNFNLKNLVILDLSRSKIISDWEAWSQIKMAKKLKVLNLSHCNGLTRTLDFSTFATLERLILKWCQNLVQIHPSIGNLKNLRLLDIAHSHITELPDAIGNLEKVEEINARGCRYLQGEIPSNIGRLSSLRILRLNCTKICSLPTGIWGLSHLQTLDLFRCGELQSLPELPPSLTSLCITGILMETFPSHLSNLMNLKELFFLECLNLVEIPRDIGKLSKLETLTLSSANISTLPAAIGALSRLKTLKIEFCKNLQCIPGLPSSLFKLCLNECESVERLPNLSNLKNLVKLMLVGCSKLMEIEGLGKLELLTSLDVSMCEKLAKLDGLEQLKFLVHLNASRCESLKRLPNLSDLGKLKELRLCECRMLVEIEGLRVLKSLETLDITRCESLKNLPDLSNVRTVIAGTTMNTLISLYTSSVSTPASGSEYEVFLSFKGQDTRYIITDYLYYDLKDAGIHTFRDAYEHRYSNSIGPDIHKGMSDSKIYIPIFSRNYASSEWCLHELVEMVKKQKTLGRKIFPIFYDVEPSDVRYQTGSYEKAFRQHEKFFDEEIVQRWKEALKEVGELKGLELKQETESVGI